MLADVWLLSATKHSFRIAGIIIAGGSAFTLPRPQHHYLVNENMQAKLLEAVASQREAGRQLQQAQQAFDAERAHLEQQVRMGKEGGSVRIQTLEETIRKLGNRSDLHQVGSFLDSVKP